MGNLKPETGTRPEYPTSPVLFNLVLEVLANVVRGKKEIEGTLTEKKENSFFTSCQVLKIDDCLSSKNR